MNEVIEAAPRAIEVKPAAAVEPSRLLQIAVEQGADIDKLTRLMELQERWEANEARKAFVRAMAAFKAEPMEIYKRKTVEIKHREGGGVTTYKHAELCDVVDVVVPMMAKHGLSHRWDVRRDSGRIHVRCIVTHALGHSESVELDGAPDDSGKKNAIQQAASTVSYLQRYTLLAIVGLATKDQIDDDGQGGEAPSDPLVDDLIERLKKTTTDADALAFWLKERVALKSGSPGYAKFKEACVAHRTALGQKVPE